MASHLLRAFLLLALALSIAPPAAAATPVLTPERWKQLEKVQSSVFKMPVRTDMERLNQLDLWQVADAQNGGDCEDHALAARQSLLALGWPAEALRIAMGWTEQGAYHAVLTVDVTTPKGSEETYVLDSRFHRIESWKTLSRIGYRWDRRQAAAGPQWVTIAGG